jgi:glucokinase
MLATAVLKSSKIPAVGIDLGGTTIKAALVSPELEVVAHEEVATDLSSQAALLESIAQLVVKVRGASDVLGVGFGLPSQVNQLTGRVAASTNVPIADQCRLQGGDDASPRRGGRDRQ